MNDVSPIASGAILYWGRHLLRARRWVRRFSGKALGIWLPEAA